jgi:hypothetical protein
MSVSESPVVLVNLQLARQGREERVLRTRGYYLLMYGEATQLQESGLYSLGGRMLRRSEADYRLLCSAVREKLAELGVTINFEE